MTATAPRARPLRRALRALSTVMIVAGAILLADAGLTLLWQDVTERTRAEQALKRNEERLALAAEGANDGLWELDVRSQEFYSSSRWRAMLGLPATAGVSSVTEWFNRAND